MASRKWPPVSVPRRWRTTSPRTRAWQGEEIARGSRHPRLRPRSKSPREPRGGRSIAVSGLLTSHRVQLGVHQAAQLIEARGGVAPRLAEQRLRRGLEIPLEATLGRRRCDLNNGEVCVLSRTGSLGEQEVRYHRLALHHLVEKGRQ